MRRRIVAAAVAVALAAACASDEPSTIDADGETTSTVAAEGTTAPGVAPPTSDGAITSDTSAPATTMRSGAAPPPPTNPSTGQVTGNVDVGQLGPYILRADQSSKIVLEVSAQSGAEPAGSTVDHLSRVLREVSGKPVAVDGPKAIGGGARSWSADELRQLGESTSRTAQGGGVAVLRLLFLHGDFGGDDQVLGIAVRGDIAAVFVDRIDDASDVLTSPAVLEDAVTSHEVGHLLGLVDLVLHTGRQDPGHPGHSRNQGSVMYWAVESSVVTQLLAGGPPRDFDADDLADLRTIRGG